MSDSQRRTCCAVRANSFGALSSKPTAGSRYSCGFHIGCGVRENKFHPSFLRRITLRKNLGIIVIDTYIKRDRPNGHYKNNGK